MKQRTTANKYSFVFIEDAGHPIAEILFKFQSS